MYNNIKCGLANKSLPCVKKKDHNSGAYHIKGRSYVEDVRETQQDRVTC